jgi:aminoglycoside phosphotransferase family enzyme
MPPPQDPNPGASCAESAALAEKLQFLRTGAAYGSAAERVETLETHMSWLFFAGDAVFKLKKPVKYPFLDFSTVAARERVCRAEVRLNSRLAADVYRGVVPLWRGPDGHFALGGAPASATIVEWLVAMRRLPRERMLDSLIRNGTVEPTQVDSITDLLAAFYRSAPACRMTPERYADRFAEQQAINREVLTHPAFDRDHLPLDDTLGRFERALGTHRALLLARARDGRVVDGHGDLRPEHVCLMQPPAIIDCLEFNDDLRCVDPVDELAHFGLECDVAGAGWIGPRVIERYAAAVADPPPARLVALYTAYRALLRARLCLAHLLEPTSRSANAWIPRAQGYLRSAAAAVAAL